MIILIKLYLAITSVFVLNALSELVFDFTYKQCKQTMKDILFSLIWIVAIFSVKGRKKLFNHFLSL